MLIKNKHVSTSMKLSIVIPVHNEEQIIEKTIKTVISCLRNYNYEIIVVNDNSNDSTGKILDFLTKKYNKIKVIHKINTKPGPTGLGSALKYGFKAASGEIIIPLMGDMSDNPKDIIKFVNKIENGYDVVCGSRFIKGSKISDYPAIKYLCNRLYNKLFSFLFILDTNDISNAFKAYRREVIDTVKPTSRGFEITAEIVLRACIHGFRIGQVPVSWRERTSEEGKSKFVSFNSFRSIFLKLPTIGFIFFIMSFKFWIIFLIKQLFPRFKN